MNKIIDDKFFKIDGRNKQDIILDIKNLAKSYVPEWIYNLQDADAGSVIATIYAAMLEDDINKLNMLMYKYRIELMNMIGVTLKSARPARSVVTFSLLPTADEGTYVPQKTKLIATGIDGNKVIFETKNSLYVTNSVISDIYATSRECGKIIQIFDVKSNQDKSFYMFDYSSNGIQRNELVIGHPYALNLNKNAILSISFKAEEKYQQTLLNQLSDNKKYEWCYLNEDGFLLFDSVKQKDGKILLTKNRDSAIVSFKGSEQSYISVRPKYNSICDELRINDIEISSFCKGVLPEIIYQGDTQVDINEFYPFGDRLAIYSECYIASDDVLSKKNAQITLEFDINYLKNVIELSYNNNTEYKVIMKKPNQTLYDMPECKIESIIFEYFNGVGWARLDLEDKNYSNLFMREIDDRVVLKFLCPNDIEKIVVNAYTRYWIRIRLLKADNCYRIPSCHMIPIISNLMFSYDYDKHVIKPKYVLRYSGVSEDVISDSINKNESTVIFRPLKYNKNSIFIGFDKKFCDGPINLYFDIEGGFKKDKDYIRFEYSCIDNDGYFKPLKVIDETENFRHSGSIIFIPPSDMSKHKIFNKDRYWIKIIDDRNEFISLKCLKIKNIILNTVSVENVETKSPEVFYVDKSKADMKIQLANDSILYADVYINEVTTLSIQQMDDMLKLDPNNIIVEYDQVGSYLSFFVKWNEVDTFVKSGPNDRHYILDRSKNMLIFGNAINGKIPEKQLRAAIQVFVVTCNGGNGNVGVGAINKTDVMINFVSSVINPIPAYTGDDMEDIDSALRRGANILSGYNRLVSQSDFEKAVLDFSSVIDKVKCVASVNEYGKEDAQSMTIVVLMKEFEKSSEVFVDIKRQIKNDLISRCELSLKPENLYVIDPIFVELCVDIWLNVHDHNISFEVRNEVIDYLKLFIDPVNGNFNNEGWEIGRLPKEVQIYSFLKSKNINAAIKKIIITGRVKSVNGVVEKEVNDIKDSLFMVGINGKHNVFIDFC